MSVTLNYTLDARTQTHRHTHTHTMCLHAWMGFVRNSIGGDSMGGDNWSGDSMGGEYGPVWELGGQYGRTSMRGASLVGVWGQYGWGVGPVWLGCGDSMGGQYAWKLNKKANRCHARTACRCQ